MQSTLEHIPRGAVVEASALIATRFAARFINPAANSKALASLAGAKRSKQRGRGVEFDEVRQYAPGDDVRAIDWRVTARSGEAHTKLFHEERERPVLVAVDQRSAMKFGSRNCFKSVMAAEVAALLLWAALDRGERIGGMIFDDNHYQDIRPQRAKTAVLAMIRELVAFGGAQAAPAAGQPLSLADTLGKLRRITRPGATVFIISDFNDAMDPAALDALTGIVRQAQVIGVRISDVLERDLPMAGQYVVTDGMTRHSLNTYDTRLKNRYQEQAASAELALQQAYRRLRIPLLNISTEDAPLPALQRIFPSR